MTKTARRPPILQRGVRFGSYPAGALPSALKMQLENAATVGLVTVTQ